jgi:Leucine-rich repeat (LRR) protein
MKQKLLFSLLSTLICSFGIAQSTFIPDEKFELALINEGYESGPPDGIIATWKMNSITLLYISNYDITDLTGIEDATNLMVLDISDNQITNLDLSNSTDLESFYCSNNLLTSLDLSNNKNLEYLICIGNQLNSLNVTQNGLLKRISGFDNELTNLDISNNPVLEHLDIVNNQITSLDVTNNVLLTDLLCTGNQLTSLDVSQNTSLTWFSCGNNQLTSLNVKNGNNSLITSFYSENNPSLLCIQVDNEVAANNNLAPYDVWNKDAFATYSENCELSIEDERLNKGLKLYPNPTSNWLFFESEVEIHKLEIYSVLGQKVKEINSDFSTISIDNLSNGIYMVHIFSEKGTTIRKIIKR